MSILLRTLAGAGFGLAVGVVASIAIGAIFGVAFEAIITFPELPLSPNDPDDLPATFSIMTGIMMAMVIGAPLGPLIGAMVFPLAEVRIYPDIIVGLAVGILTGLAAGFILGRIVDFPAWPGSSTLPSEIFIYSAISAIAGSIAGVVAGNSRRIPIPGGIIPGWRR